MTEIIETAILGGGCFWCTEAVFSRLNGVLKVTPGYAGGNVDKPTYQQVCGGTTGHAEVNKIDYDPSVISYTDLLDDFSDLLKQKFTQISSTGGFNLIAAYNARTTGFANVNLDREVEVSIDSN